MRELQLDIEKKVTRVKIVADGLSHRRSLQKDTRKERKKQKDAAALVEKAYQRLLAWEKGGFAAMDAVPVANERSLPEILQGRFPWAPTGDDDDLVDIMGELVDDGESRPRQANDAINFGCARNALTHQSKSVSVDTAVCFYLNVMCCPPRFSSFGAVAHNRIIYWMRGFPSPRQAAASTHQ